MRIFLYKKSDVLRCSSKPLFPFGGFTYPFLRRNDTSLSLYCTAHTGNSVRDKAVRASAVLWGSLPCIPSIKHLAFIDILPSARAQECSGAYGERTVYPSAAVSRGSTCALPRPFGLICSFIFPFSTRSFGWLWQSGVMVARDSP